MRDIEKFVLYSMITNLSDPYDTINYDDEIDECLMNMYFFMISDKMNNDKREELWQAFESSYQKLNSEQQEIVKKDYLSIIDAQNKNKEKVKKKGMINYE